MASLRDHLQVLQALMIRDLMVRFGRQYLGFVWTILEPMILTTGVMTIWSMIKEPIIHGIPIITFVFTGYMPLTLWRHMTNPMTKILRRESALMFHRPVSHVHIVLARSFLEFLSTSAALAVVYFAISALGVIEPIADPGLVLAGWIFTGWYFGAMGLIIAAVTERWEPVEKFIPAMQYLALPLSGVFFMIDWMPEYAQKLLLFNPSVHCFEMFRAGFLGESIVTHYDATYLAMASAVLTMISVASIYHIRGRIQFQ